MNSPLWQEQERGDQASLGCAWQAQHPCPACPCPTAALCYAHVPPQQQHYCTHPLSAISPHVLCVLLPLLLAFTAAPPLQPVPHPCSCPPCSHDSQIHTQLYGVAASPAQGALAPLGHCCSTNSLSHSKSCRGGRCSFCCGWEDSRMSCTTGSCRCLHPLSASSGLAVPLPAAP